MSKTITTPPPSKAQLDEWYKQESEGSGVITSADVEAHAETTPISPMHYRGTIECIDVMRQIVSAEVFAGHCQLTALKYVWRAGAKQGAKASEDLGKARVYLGWAIESLEEQGR